MPILFELFQSHVRHHDYMTEISICDKPDCKVCRKFSKGIRTPITKDGLSRYILLRPMDRPVADPMNPGHYISPSKTASFITEKSLSFNQLKKELPPLDRDPFQAEETKADKKADNDAGGSKLFKGQKVRDIAICNNCDFPRAIFSMRQLKSRALNLSQQGQKNCYRSLIISRKIIHVVMHVLLKGMKLGGFCAVGILWKHNTSRLQMVEMIGTVTYVAIVAVMKISYHSIR